MSEEISDPSSRKTEDYLAKIAINKDADRALSEVIGRVNDGFEAGRATKQEVASHIILNFAKDCTESEIHAIRAMFFNPILLMEATLKKAKETGVLPDSLRDLLFEQFSSGLPATKKSKKNLNNNIIKDNVISDKEAA
jgi:hypothetical protein